MLIAREKKKNNIAEYILYMWQLEDMLRALKLDMEQVDRYLVAGFQADERTSKEIHDWYDNLIAIMQKEKVEEKGHIQALKNTVDELTELHFFLLHQAHDGRYRQLVTQAAGNLVEFRRKAGVDDTVSDVELALNGLYGQLMLKLQKREIHPETVAAMESLPVTNKWKKKLKIQNFNLIEYESANCSVVPVGCGNSIESRNQ